MFIRTKPKTVPTDKEEVVGNPYEDKALYLYPPYAVVLMKEQGLYSVLNLDTGVLEWEGVILTEAVERAKWWSAKLKALVSTPVQDLSVPFGTEAKLPE